jgi:hypothetical protein
MLSYGKDEQDDLTAEQKKQLGAVIKRIKDALNR